MPSRSSFSSALLLAFSTSLVEIAGFETNIGDCKAGTDALLQPGQIEDLRVHGALNQVGGGPISDFDLQLELDGIPLDTSIPNEFDFGVDHTLDLVALNEPFAGFFVRLQSIDGSRTLGAIQPVDGDSQETCKVGITTAGACHTNNIRKQFTNMTLNMETMSAGLILDVTVVIETSIANNISHWYYSRYTLNSVVPKDQPTDSPTTSSMPSTAPITATGVPTIGPTAPEVTPAPSEAEEEPKSGGMNSWVQLNVRQIATLPALVSLAFWLL